MAAAAFRVNVKPRMLSGLTPLLTRLPILWVIVSVLPLPGTAITEAIPFLKLESGHDN
jgi:hypothetical protein